MPLKIPIKREYPVFESLNAKDQQRFVVFISRLYDNLEEITRQAEETGTKVEQIETQQKTLINNLASPSISSSDPILGSVGNLTADLKNEIVGVVVVGGKVAIKDNNGNVKNFLVE